MFSGATQLTEPHPVQNDENPGTHGFRSRPRTGVFAFRALRLVLALALTLGASGCGESPDAFPAAMDAALASGDPAAVSALLTSDSRALLDVMRDAPHPDGRHPFAMHAPKRPTRTVEVLAPDAETRVLRVNDGERDGEWVLRKEAGAWRLDLAASASRRPFLGL